MDNFFYDLEELKAIPVRSIAQEYGLKPAKQKHMFYSPFGERTASLYLYETGGQNRFYDFGGGRNVGGGPIELVSYITGLEWKDAVQELGRTFGIQPLENEKSECSYELSDKQWSKIGIFGDLATKNFDFSYKGEHAHQRKQAIMNKYDMTMNELRKKNPGVFKKVIENRAFSYMQACQQHYFNRLSVEFTAMQLSGFQTFDAPTKSGIEELENILKDIKSSEKVLKHVLKGTDLEYSFYPYNISEDFKKVASGDVELEVGSVSSYELKVRAKGQGKKLDTTEIKASTLDALKILDLNYLYSAIQKGDKVFVEATPDIIQFVNNFEMLLDNNLELGSLNNDSLEKKVNHAKEKITENGKTVNGTPLKEHADR